MSVSVTVRGNPININKGNVLLCDIDQLRTNEINRRRKLRIQQVRQQSKDIANMIRERVRDEAARQLGIFKHHQTAELKKLQSEKLHSLQQQYQECLQEIGSSHQQAALQPDAEVELARQREINQAIAQERGQEAAAKLKQEKDAVEEQKKAEKKLHKYSRTIENLRSTMVVSMGSKPPKRCKSPTERPCKKMPLQELPTNIISRPKEPQDSRPIKLTVKSHCRFCRKSECLCTDAKEYSKRLRQALPAEDERKRSSTYSPILPSNISSSSIEEDIQAAEVLSHLPEEQTAPVCENGSEISSELTDKSYPDYSAMPLPHQKSWRFPISEKVKIDETTDSPSSGMKDYDEPHTTHLKNDEGAEEGYYSSTSDVSSTCTCFAEPCLCSQLRELTTRRRKVPLYDYANKYHSECLSYPRVERHLYEKSEPDAVQAAEMQEAAMPSTIPKNAQEALKRVRGNQALMREKISRDYKELLDKLSSLAREERLARSAPVNCLPEEAYLTEERQNEVITKRQKHMDAVFESAFRDIIPQKSSELPSIPEPEPAKRPPSEYEESPLKLNVAQWKKISPSKPDSSVQEMPIKKTSDIEQPVEPNVSEPSALEELMKRVNMQRALLLEELGVSTVSPSESQNNQATETATRNSKAERILQSIHESLIASLSSVSLESIEDLSYASHKPESISKPTSGTGKEEIRDKDADLNKTPLAKEPSDEEHISTSPVENYPSRKATEEERKFKKSDESKLHKKRSAKKKQREGQLEEKDKKNYSSSSSATLVNEYSIDMSRSRTIEHSVDNGIESFNSSTSAYEEVKIIVSVTERAQQTPPRSPSKKKKQKINRVIASPKKPQRQQVHPVPTKRLQKTHDEKSKTSVSKTTAPEISKPVGRKHPVQEKRVCSKEKRTKDATIQTCNESNLDQSTTWVERLQKSNSSISKYESEISSCVSPPRHVCADRLGQRDKHQPEVASSAEYKPTNTALSCYISRLLAMTRDSIDNLQVSSSEVSSSSLTGVKINAAMQTESVVDEEQKLYSKANIDIGDTRRIAEDDRPKMLHESVQLPQYTEEFKPLHTSSSSAFTAPAARKDMKETADQTELVEDELLVQKDREKFTLPEELISISPPTVLDKYPKLLDDMTATCLRNISKLNKSIEEIRMEQKKLIEMSLSGSGTSSSSNSNGNDNNRSNNSTRYRSPPPKSRIMAPAKPREMSKSPIEEVDPTTVTSTPNTYIKVHHLHEPGYQEECSCNISKTNSAHQSLDQSAQTKQETFRRNGNAGFARNLSTIFEVDSSASSQHQVSRRDSERSPSSREKENVIQKAQSVNTDSDSESMPDVMAEMLRRGLISSPLTWSRTSAGGETLKSDHKVSSSSTKEPNTVSSTKGGNDVQNSTPRILQALAQMGSNPTPEDKKAFCNSFGIEWEDVASCFESDSSNQDTSSLLDKTLPTTLKKNSNKQHSNSEIKVSVIRDCRSAESSAKTSPVHSDLVEIICNRCNSIMVKCTCDLLPDIPSSENLTSDSGF